MEKFKLFIHKASHWEYWPFGLIYVPIYAWWLYYSMRSRSFFFFNAANPRMKNGGFLMESKKEIYDLIPGQFYPKTVLICVGDSCEMAIEVCKRNGLSYPLIAKPDVGMRGMAVQKLESEYDLVAYSRRVNFDFLIQEYVDLPHELGVFFVRYPDQAKGNITGIVQKEFLTIIGDGISSVRSLLLQNPRFHMQLAVLEKSRGRALDDIPSKGRWLNLVPYGNHARGARFIDATVLATEKLNQVINDICLAVPEFYYGRMDIKYNTIEELEQGVNLSVIELNGAGSEPTHIYDPGQTLPGAWKEIRRHLDMLFRISLINKRKGYRFLTFWEGIEMLRQNRRHVRKLQAI